MTGIKICKIQDAHLLILLILYYQAHLIVYINICRSIGYIVEQHPARIWNIGNTQFPKPIIILYLVEKIKIFQL